MLFQTYSPIQANVENASQNINKWLCEEKQAKCPTLRMTFEHEVSHSVKAVVLKGCVAQSQKL
jgi:hypothetical protein